MAGGNRRRREPQAGQSLAIKDERLTIEEAEQLATSIDAKQERIDAWAEEHAFQASLEAHFRHLSASDVLRLWKAGVNDDGKKLTKFEGMALMEHWAALTGKSLPDTGSGTTPATPPPAAPQTPEPADDTMLRVGEVLRLTSLSLSTLKRHVADGLFPKPVKLSPRRNGWKAGVVKAWLAEREAASDYTPSRTDRQHRGRGRLH